jgi:hypothetical protein
VPFRTRPGQTRDLLSLVDAEVRERIEEAVDFVSLDVIVQNRRARGLPPPAADNADDRREFEAGVTAFLERLAADLGERLSAEQQRKLEEITSRAGNDRVARLVAIQVALAKQLPDYWQQFETIRARHTEARGASGGERRGFLARFFGP